MVVKRSSNWSQGENCQIKGLRGIYKILWVNNGPHPTVHVSRLNKDGTITKKKITGISTSQLLQLDEEQPKLDSEVKTAYQAALELCKCGFVMTDFIRTTSERLAKVKKITKSGRIVVSEVQIITGLKPKYTGEGKNKVRDSEVELIDFSELTYKEEEDLMTFVPFLYRGQWKFMHKKSKVLKHAKMTKTNLLT